MFIHTFFFQNVLACRNTSSTNSWCQDSWRTSALARIWSHWSTLSPLGFTLSLIISLYAYVHAAVNFAGRVLQHLINSFLQQVRDGRKVKWILVEDVIPPVVVTHFSILLLHHQFLAMWIHKPEKMFISVKMLSVLKYSPHHKTTWPTWWPHHIQSTTWRSHWCIGQ